MNGLEPPQDVLKILNEVGEDPEMRDCVWERIV
jgi:hypothetical protein